MRRHSAVGFGAVALAAFVTLAAPGVGTAVGAAIGSATPAVNLRDGQTISLTGTGFDPAAQVGMTECVSGAVGIAQCDLAGIRFANTDESGSFATDFRVTRVIDVAGTLTDCAAPDACVVGIEETNNQAVTATVSISFENLPIVPPAVTVDPAADLATGQAVEVIGAGFTPSATVVLVECPANSALISDCDLFTGLFVKADGGGTVDTEYPVVEVISVNGSSLDCATAPTCVLSVGNVDDFAQRSVVPISFGTPPTLSAGTTFSPTTNLRDCRFGVAPQCPPLSEQLALPGTFRAPGTRR
ncbi:MAG TPA: neocarzinostatin apoprotein domain-containing protein [Acidimicrobiales bacterium]|nr:neocarzinostatin apoprotein domain-containing protein [Acidimicrobiales bacterium]